MKGKAASAHRVELAGRWGAFGLAVLLPVGLNLLGVALLWIVVLRSSEPAGTVLAGAMTLAAVVANLLLYTAM